MSARTRIRTTSIDPLEAILATRDPAAGGTVVFIGTIRNNSENGRVTRLRYEAYREMAEKKMREIERETRERWPVKKVVLLHREGELRVGEVSVVVAVSSAHRAEAFKACRYAIDRIKATLPLWKKERVNGKEVWVEGTPISG